MGFTKRYISKEMILRDINNGYPLHKTFNADALILEDEIASSAYKQFKEGKTNDEIKDFILSYSKPLIDEK